jgi:hypothetical protein
MFGLAGCASNLRNVTHDNILIGFSNLFRGFAEGFKFENEKR